MSEKQKSIEELHADMVTCATRMREAEIANVELHNAQRAYHRARRAYDFARMTQTRAILRERLIGRTVTAIKGKHGEIRPEDVYQGVTVDAVIQFDDGTTIAAESVDEDSAVLRVEWSEAARPQSEGCKGSTDD